MHPSETDVRTATVVKQREFRKGDIFRFTLLVVELGNNRHGEPVTTCVVQVADEEASGVAASRSLFGRNKLALDIPVQLLEADGALGHPDVPCRLPSVSERDWRKSFYDHVMPDAKGETRRKAFHRALMALLKREIVKRVSDRVWLFTKNSDEGGCPETEPSTPSHTC